MLVLLLLVARAVQPCEAGISQSEENARRGRVVSFLMSSLKVSAGRYAAAISDFSNDLLAERGESWTALPQGEQDWTLADRVLDLYEAGGPAKVIRSSSIRGRMRDMPLTAVPKIRHHFRNKVTKKCAPKLVFFNEKKLDGFG